jgi:hypothetical protein
MSTNNTLLGLYDLLGCHSVYSSRHSLEDPMASSLGFNIKPSLQFQER